MSLPVSRITDIGEGKCPLDDDKHRNSPAKPLDYTTDHATAASTVFSNNLGQCVSSSTTGNQSCGHTSTATTGSNTVFAENLAVHRLSDTGVGEGGDTYTNITGSPDVFAG